jgi:hypothetical protein
VKVSRNSIYSYGWSDPRAYTQTVKHSPTYTHTRSILLELEHDPYTSTIKHNTVTVHNDHIHGVTNAATDSASL